MKILISYQYLFIILILCASNVRQMSAQDVVSCNNPRSRCYGTKVTCPPQCPYTTPNLNPNPHNPYAPICYLNCAAPWCYAECKDKKPNCKGIGAACYDPRFVGADGAVFYFHGKRNEHFTLVSDTDLQINAHFIGHRPTGRPRDYTWIQALGILFGSHYLSVEATKAATWDNSTDHLKFSFDSNEVVLEQGALSAWKSEKGDVTLERISNMNSVIVSIPDVVEIGVNVVPITKEEDRVHNYQIPSDDCFSHLEVQFRFFDLSPGVEGVLGRTYQPGYESQAMLGNAMPVVGGENKYRTTSLFAADCKKCVFSSMKNGEKRQISGTVDHGTMDCSGKLSGGYGIACKK